VYSGLDEALDMKLRRQARFLAAGLLPCNSMALNEGGFLDLVEKEGENKAKSREIVEK
jgi:hypothetical protein